jgi:hypothetical protein
MPARLGTDLALNTVAAGADPLVLGKTTLYLLHSKQVQATLALLSRRLARVYAAVRGIGRRDAL